VKDFKFVPSPEQKAIIDRRAGNNIGIYGGSFNPPHLGHTFMILAVMATQLIDEIWVLPCADHPFKSDLAPFEHRVKMCQWAFGHLANVHVMSLEGLLPKPNYTAQTLGALKGQCPELDLHYIIGSDLAEEIPSWSHADNLSELAKFVIVPRQGHPLTDAPEILGDYSKVELGFDLPELSSTHLKRMMDRGASVEGFFDKDILNHVKKLNLYGYSND